MNLVNLLVEDDQPQLISRLDKKGQNLVHPRKDYAKDCCLRAKIIDQWSVTPDSILH